MTRHPAPRYCGMIALSVAFALVGTAPATAVTSGRARADVRLAASAARRAPRVTCVASDHTYDNLAARMARDIDAKLAGRSSSVGLKEIDSKTGVTCTYHPTYHFYAASVIKATILGALLRMAQEQGRHLTATEKRRAWLMITQSSNDAATALWNEVGMRRMQHFLTLAKMTQTELAHAWGLSLLTARDEILLLTMLSSPNRILNLDSRVYAQYLMSHVISSQRWGVPAGAPESVKVHLKNGWLPYPVSSNWEINSVGFFIARKPYRNYEIAMLTHENPSMAYGIETIEDVAQAIHRDLNPGVQDVIPKSVPNPTWGIPDEPIPAKRH
ncbi:MAG TPA: serine hydrolase [Streptosporangiaceae bacterium]